MKYKDPEFMKASAVAVGDRVSFLRPGSGYVVEAVEETAIGMVRHRHSNDTGSNSYWAGEVLVVERPEEAAE